MVTRIASEKAGAGLRYAIVCWNVTESAEERIVQSKRVRAGSLAIIVISHKWREFIPSRLFVVLFPDAILHSLTLSSFVFFLSLYCFYFFTPYV